MKKLLKKELKSYRYEYGPHQGDYSARLYKGRSKTPLATFYSLCEMIMWLRPQGLTFGKGGTIERSAV